MTGLVNSSIKEGKDWDDERGDMQLVFRAELSGTETASLTYQNFITTYSSELRQNRRHPQLWPGKAVL